MLKTHGVKKGDRVAIYMSMCPLAVAAMLGCARALELCTGWFTECVHARAANYPPPSP